MTGSYSDPIVGMYYGRPITEFPGLEDFININSSTGTISTTPSTPMSWERMYAEPRPVIIICVACGSGNVITSPCCVQCGAPMGWSLKNQQMVYR